jgi:hypothetical protein
LKSWKSTTLQANVSRTNSILITSKHTPGRTPYCCQSTKKLLLAEPESRMLEGKLKKPRPNELASKPREVL